jgi:hypothetical protein
MYGKRPDPTPYSMQSQSALLGWGVERVFNRLAARDRADAEALVKPWLKRIEAFHRWAWRERDVRGMGLLTVGTYGPLDEGAIMRARFETFDFEACLDGLTLTSHPDFPQRTGFYGTICTPGQTSFLIASERSLARLATALKEPALAARALARAESASESMRRLMWNEAKGTFVAVHRDTLVQSEVATIGSWLPLWAGVPTPAQAARMAQELTTADWATTLPIPSLFRSSDRFGTDAPNSPLKCGIMWRGDVWPPTNYLVATGLAEYGHRDVAIRIGGTLVRNALRVGINERYHPDDGRPLGVPGLGMSGTVLTLMLDGLVDDDALRLTTV